MRIFIQGVICAFAALAIGACAGSSDGKLMAGATSSAPQMEAAPVTAGGRPDQIVVYPFATTGAEVTLNQGVGARIYRRFSDSNQTADQQQLAQATAQNICMQVATSLASGGWNAACQPRGTPVTNNTLIVDGVFQNISEGNRAQRMVIGLGVGQSVVDTAVRLYQNSNGNSAELMTFTTHADSGKMPGVGITGPAGAAAGGATAAASLGVNVAAGGAKSITSTTGYLVDQSAKQIVLQVNNYCSQQGWKPSSSGT